MRRMRDGEREENPEFFDDDIAGCNLTIRRTFRMWSLEQMARAGKMIAPHRGHARINDPEKLIERADGSPGATPESDMASTNVSSFDARRRIHYKVNGRVHTMMSDRDEVSASEVTASVLFRMVGVAFVIAFVTLGVLWFKSQLIG